LYQAAGSREPMEAMEAAVAKRGESYEVYIFRDGRWTVNGVHKTESAAKAQAQSLFKDKRTDGVRVVQEWQASDGTYRDKALLEQIKQKEAQQKDISLSEITEAPPCQAYNELYGIESRSTVNRLLRKYLDEVVLTPTELLHNNRELKRLLDLDITQSAVDRVATLQAKQNGSDSREHRDVLYGFVEQAWLRLRRLGDRPDVPRVQKIGFAAAVEQIDATAAPEERDFLALVALLNELVDLRNWSAKMQTLIDQMDKAGASRAVGLIDRVIADICGARGIIPELVARRPIWGHSFWR